HSTLYFLSDELFDSPYFYGPLLVFDTIVLGAVLSTTGAASADFYAACLLTAILSVICNDPRGLLLVTIVAPLAYGYFVFSRAAALDPGVYLRLPFPFVISLFYGYFAEVERLRRSGRDKEAEIKRQQKSAASASAWKCCTRSTCRSPPPSIRRRFWPRCSRPRLFICPTPPAWCGSKTARPSKRLPPAGSAAKA